MSRRKILKGLLALAVLLFCGGAFSLFGLNNQSQTTITTNIESTVGDADLSNAKNTGDSSEHDIVRNTDSLTTKVTANATGSLQQRFAAAGYNVYEISSASELGRLAYLINTTNTDTDTYEKTIYFLTTNIDLSTEYWTPIGTASNPFRGIFYGNGFTISNIYINDMSIDTNSNSGSGLFGNNSGVIANVKINNVVDTSSKVTTKKGTIVGLNSGYVVDSAGTIGSNSENKTQINSTSINANGGVFKRENNPWYVDDEIKIVDRDSGQSASEYRSGLTKAFDFYQTKADQSGKGFVKDSFYTYICRRQYANETTNQIYVINSGKWATLEEDGTNYKFTWTDKNVEVSFDYGYGTRKNVEVTIGYDKTFKDFFDSNPVYKQRIGYNFASLQVSAGDERFYDTDGNIYNQSYPYYNMTDTNITSTAYFNWEEKNPYPTTSYTIELEAAKTEPEGKVNLANVGAIITKDNEIKNLDENNNIYQISIESNTHSQSFTVTLNEGYELLTNGYEGNGQSADDLSGVYVNFTNSTGEGTSYSVDGKNNDSYNPVSATVTKEENSNTYTVTINNLVGGSNGYVYLAVQRTDVKIKLEAEHVEYTNYSVEYKNYVLINTEGSTLDSTKTYYTRSGNGTQESPYEYTERTGLVTFAENTDYYVKGFYVEFKDDSNKIQRMEWTVSSGDGSLEFIDNNIYLVTKFNEDVVVAIDGKKGSLVLHHLNNETSGNNVRFKDHSISDDTYHTSCSATISVEDLSTNPYVKWIVGQLKTKVRTEFYDSSDDNKKITSLDGIYSGLSLEINDVKGITVDESGSLITLHENDNSFDTFTIKPNGYYTVDYIDVYSILNQEPETINFNGSTQITDKRYLKNVFDGSDTNYTIKVYLTKRKYNVKVECYIGNSTIPDGLVTIKNSSYSDENWSTTTNPNIITPTITLTETGKTLLKYVSCVVENYDNPTYSENSVTSSSNGYKLSTLSGTNNFNQTGVYEFKPELTLGTYYTKVKLCFAYKTVTVNINAPTGADAEKWEENSGTYQFNYNNGTVGLINVSPINSLNVRADLYLKGWAGIENNTFSIKDNAVLVDYITGQGIENINKDFAISITPVVENRKINVTYSSGLYLEQISSDDGELWENIIQTNAGTLNSLTSTITLAANDSQFKRLGNAQNGWTFSYGSNGTYGYVISAKSDWNKIFNGSDASGEYQSWSYFTTADVEDVTIKGVTLTAEWTPISYELIIDNNTTMNIQIGESIFFESTSDEKQEVNYGKGTANYTINTTTKSIPSLGRNGYIATGFTIKHDAQSEAIEGGATTPFELSISNAKDFLNSNTYFSANSNPFIVETVTTEAEYTITIKTNEAYTITKDSTQEVDQYGDITQEVTYNKPYTVGGNFARAGYNYDGFLRTDCNPDVVFALSGTFLISSDIEIQPTWILASNTTNAGITNIADASEFYMFNSKDIFTGLITANNYDNEISINKLLVNGEKIIEFGFIVTDPYGTDFIVTNKTTLNLKDLVHDGNIYAGVYKIKFFISCEDTLLKQDGVNNIYTVYSSEQTIELNKNTILFNADNNIHSIYTGTSEFVEGESNRFGTFGFVNDYSSTARSYNLVEDDVNNSYFEAFSVVDEDKNVGLNKTLRLYLNAEMFSGERLGTDYGTNFSEIFDNVYIDDNGYYIDQSILTIDKAKITLDGMTNGSSFYTGSETTVAYNNGNNYHFQIGETVFEYTYNKVTLKADCEVGTYTGEEDFDADSENFVVYGLTVVDGISITSNGGVYVDGNFEWNIPTIFTFIILDSSDEENVDIYTYEPKYLTATNGILKPLSDATNEILTISNLKVDNVDIGAQIITRSSYEGTYQIEDSVLFSYIGNGTKSITLYLNKQLANGHSLSYNVNLSGIGEVFMPLGWADNSTTISEYQEMLDSYQNGPLSVDDETALTNYVVLSDVVKLKLDYNTGFRASKGQETFYISSDEGYDISNPEHSYEGLLFAGYDTRNIASYLTAQSGNGKYTFTSVKGGNPQTLIAQWNLDSVVGEQKETTFNTYASIGEQTIALEDIASFELPSVETYNGATTTPSTSISYSLAGTGGVEQYVFIPENGVFKIFKNQNEEKLVTRSMSGTYTLTATLRYSDGIRSEQTKTLSYDISYTVTKNVVGIEKVTQSLIFNNRERSGEFKVNTFYTGNSDWEDKENISLSSVPKIAENSGSYGFYITMQYESNKEGAEFVSISEVKNAGTYKITANIADKYADIFELAQNYTSFEFTVNKYTIVLENYKEAIENVVYKIFGEDDPSNITGQFDVIDGELNLQDTITLEFTRYKSGNAETDEIVGFYALSYVSIVSDGYDNNYIIDDTDFSGQFEIRAPENTLLVRLLDTITYVYNGKGVDHFDIAKSGDYFYLYAIDNGNNTLGNQIEIEMYYLDTSGAKPETVMLSEYNGYITISCENSKNVGTYALSVVLNDGTEWDDVQFTSVEKAKVDITSKDIAITKITKVFDRTNEITSNTTVEFDAKVEGDDLFASGTFENEFVGDGLSFENLALIGSDAGNYTLTNRDFSLGSIIKLSLDPTEISLTAKNSVNYGDISNTTTLEDLLEMLDVTLSINGVTDDIENGYISYTSWQANESYFSTADKLKAADQRPIYFTFESDDFSNLTDEFGQDRKYVLYIKINKIQIDLSELVIEKFYDGSSDLSEDSLELIIDKINSKKIEGDDLGVTAEYNDEKVGKNKLVTVTLTGADEANYKTANIYGEIKEYAVTFNVNASTENEFLVTDGAFVNDGISPVVTKSSFIFIYPTTISAEQALLTLSYPTRTGYAVKGWAYYDEGYTEITTSNILGLIEDVANGVDKEITIFAIWEINEYEVSVSGNNIESYQAKDSGDNVINPINDKYIVRYYDDINIYVTGNRGYKVNNFSKARGQAVLSNIVTGNTVGSVKVSTIKSDVEIEARFTDIKVTVNYNFVLPQYASRVDHNATRASYSYSALQSMTKDDLTAFKVTEGTYYLDDFGYNEDSRIGEKRISQVVDEIYPDLSTDTQITLTTIWAGENYKVHFDVNGGTLDGEENVDVVFGQSLTLPTATITGKTATWTAPTPTNRKYSQGENLQTVGVKEGDNWTITLTAIYTNNKNYLTVNFGDHVSVKANGYSLDSGYVISLTYESQLAELVVQTDAGYEISLDQSNFHGELTQRGNVLSIKNLTQDSSLTINAIPRTNTLSISEQNLSKVLFNSEEVDANDGAYLINARTGESVTITITAQKGVIFADDFVKFNGSGNVETQLEEDKKSATVTWAGFTDDASIEVSVVLADNVVSFGDISSIFESISLNGQALSTLGSDNIVVKTGKEISVIGVLKYGFKDASLTADTATVNNQSNEFNTTDKKYHFSATITGVNEDICLSFECERRQYEFSVIVNEEQTGFGQITCEESQTVVFGEKLTLSQNVINDSYRFVNWIMSGEIVSLQGEDELTIDQSLASLLERVSQPIVVSANYKEKVADIEFVSGINGEYLVIQGDNQFSVNSNRNIEKQVKIGREISFELTINDGYEFDKFYITVNGDEFEVEELNYDNGVIIYNIPSENPPTQIKITFKASDAIVYVDAAVSVNFELNKYTDAAGKVYMSDANGNRLAEENYLDIVPSGTEYIFGANYSFTSYTDATIYFVAEPISGFTVTISMSGSSSATKSSYKVGDKMVYAFSGVKSGCVVEAVFSAKQNKVNIVFAEYVAEGDYSSAIAGNINVDTSSAFIKASANNNSSVGVTIITGQDMTVTLNTNFCYQFDMDGNAIRYSFVKNGGDNDKSVLTIGNIVAKDPIRTGFRQSVELSITDVDTEATLYIFVKPEIYNLRFHVDGGEGDIILENVLQYGKEFSTAGLTIDQKLIVFAEKENFTLDGFYTSQLSVNSNSTKYIDGNGNVLSKWMDTGYRFNGSVYEKVAYFDEETNTFTLYPNYVYKKAGIKIYSMPNNILSNNTNLSIRNFIENYNSTYSWISQDDLWYTQIVVEKDVQIKAYNFTGYIFQYWLVSIDDGEPIIRENEFSFKLEKAEYTLIAVYNPIYTITVVDSDGKETNIGQVSLLQDDIALDGESFNSEKLIQIEATAIEGYKLLYIEDQDTGERFVDGVYDASTNTTRFTYNRLVDRPLNLKAVFEGKSVDVKIDNSVIGNYHQIDKVYINGTEVNNWQNGFTAKVGDSLSIEIVKSFGYSFEAKGIDFEVSQNGNRYTLSTELSIDKLTPKKDEYQLNISFEIEQEEVLFNIVVSVNSTQGRSEDILAGKVTLVYPGHDDIDLSENGSFTIAYGDIARLLVEAKRNYEVDQIYNTTGHLYSISTFDGSTLVLNKEFMENKGYEINLLITFNRLVWTDYKSDNITGQGTEEDPFLIYTAEDMAFVAYVVNNGIAKDEEVMYADCYYKVLANLDFSGKYFIPIGTEENPFNGTLELGSYDIRNLLHYKVYSSPRTQARGLVWFTTDNAKIIVNNSELVVSLSVAGGVLGATGVASLSAILIRRRKRRFISRI